MGRALVMGRISHILSGTITSIIEPMGGASTNCRQIFSGQFPPATTAAIPVLYGGRSPLYRRPRPAARPPKRGGGRDGGGSRSGVGSESGPAAARRPGG